MAIDFPASPSVNDIHTSGGKRWTWNGTSWERSGTPGPGDTISATNDNTTSTLYPVLLTGTGTNTAKVATSVSKSVSFNASNGTLTATTFVGNLTGNPTGTIQTAAQPNITSLGTLSALNVSGDVSIGGTLTYEDVTNIDSVGLITARDGVNISDTTQSTSTTTGALKVAGGAGIVKNLNVGGTSTFTGAIDANGALDVDGQTDLDVLNVAETATFSDAVRIVKSSGALLEVTTNTGAADATLRLSEGSTGSTINGGGMFYSGADNKLYITCGTNSTTKRITINRDDGKVGIGSEIPAATFDVAGGAQFKTNGSSVKIESSPGTNFTQLQLVNTGGNFYIGRENSAGNWFASGIGYASVLRSDGSYPLIFRVNNSNRLLITSSGHIVTQGLDSYSFNNDSANTKIFEVTGDGTVGEYGVINISANQNADNGTIGVLKFINRENSESSSGSSAGSRQVGSIEMRADTGDSNAGDDSGGYFRFITKTDGGGNAERLRITSAGDMALGTNSANNYVNYTTFTINGTTGGQLDIESNGTKYGDIYTQSNAFHVRNKQASGSGFLAFHTTNNGTCSEKLRINSTGKVRVGSGSATYNFEVQSSGFVETLIGSTNASGAGIILDGDSNGDGSGADYAQIFHQTDGSLNFRARNGSGGTSTIFLSNTTETLRITSSGYLGINTTTPQRYLHIVGNDGTSGATSANSDTQLILDNTGTNGTHVEFLNANNGSGHIMWTDTDAGNVGRLSYHHSGDYFRFDTSGNERIRINSNGHMIIAPSGYSLPTADERMLNLIAWANKPASIGFQRSNSLGGTSCGWTNELQSNGDLLWGVHNVGERLRINSAGTLRIKRAVSTSLGNDSIFLALGDTENGTNVNRMIGFGYNANFGTNVYPASMGYTETDNSGHTKGALTFNTRNTTGATDAPVERLRIQSTGQILYSAAGGDNTITSKRTNAASSNGNFFFHLKASDSNDNIVGELGFHRDTAADDSRFVIHTRNSGGSSQERLRIDSSGQVLCCSDESFASTGVASGNASMMVRGDSGAWALKLLCRHNQNDYAYLGFASQDNSENLGEIYVNRSGTGTASMRFGVRNSGTNIEAIRILSNGDFELNGNTTPAIKIDSSNSTNGSALKLEIDGTEQFRFDPSSITYKDNTNTARGTLLGPLNYHLDTNGYINFTQWRLSDNWNHLEVFGYVNPNSGGSGAYTDPVHMYIYRGVGWDQANSVTAHWIYCVHVAPPARQVFPSGSGMSANSGISAVWYHPSRGIVGNKSSNGNDYLRLVIPNASQSYNFNKNFRIIRRY